MALSDSPRGAVRDGSRGAIVSDIQFLSASGTALQIPTAQYLQKIEVEMGTDRAWTVHLSLWDPIGTFLENLIIVAGKNKNFSVQWDWDDGTGFTNTPQFIGTVVLYKPRFSTTGIGMDIDLVPNTFASQLINKKERSFAAGTPLSTIFQAIADDPDNAWKTVDRNGKSTVQDSPTVRDVAFTVGESDAKFVHEQLVPYALDDQKRGGYSFFVDHDNCYHFHNQYFGANPPQIMQTFRYARDPNGEVLDFEPEDCSLIAASMGSGNAQYDGVDALGGNRSLVTATQTAGIPGVGMVSVRSAGYVTDLGDGVHSVMHVDEVNPSLLAARASSQFERLSMLAYPARMRVIGTHAVKPFEYIEVDYFRSDGSKHYLSGVFLVLQITHTWGRGEPWTTEMALARTGIDKTADGVQITAVSTIDPTTGTATVDTAASAGQVGGGGSFGGENTQTISIPTRTSGGS